MHGQWRVGGIYSIESGEGTFGVVKVLALEPDSVHVRIYKNKFAARPDNIDPSTLSLGSILDGGDFGIGHVPLEPEGFASWQPVLLMQTELTDEELVGYRFWKESTDESSARERKPGGIAKWLSRIVPRRRLN
jgi:hypothetical protein